MDTNETSAFLAQAFSQAPGPIKSFIQTGDYERFLGKLQTTAQFDQDTLARVSDEILMMLVGMTEPQELPSNLVKEAGLSDEQARSVIAIANQEVFLPLQTASSGPAVSAPTPALVTPPKQSLVPVPAPLSAPQPAYVPPPPIRPSEPTITGPASSAPVKQTEYGPTMRTMAHDVESMKDGHAPEPVPYTIHENTLQEMQAVSPTPIVPSISSTTQKSEVEPMLNTQTAIPVPAPRVETPPPHPIRTPGTPDPKELANTLQKYGIDPYREAI